MKLFALDTTSQTLSCAIMQDGEIVAEFSIFTENTHSERLMPLIDAILKMARIDISQVDYFACAAGPGSFTGLRIGISTVKGLASANGKRVVSVSSLDALRANILEAACDICPLIDARKGEVFGAFYKKDKKTGIHKKYDEFNIAPESLVKKIKRKTLFLGNGAVLYKNIISGALKEKALFVPGELNHIKGLNVARLAIEKIRLKETIKPEFLAPVYIRESDAEINFKD